jgi:DNA-directed RNA polymerase subunit M/transcription elongation factor TFIIS
MNHPHEPDATVEAYIMEAENAAAAAASAAAAGITLEEYRRREDAYDAELEAEDAARVAAGGRTTCPACKQRSVVEHLRPTRQYGGGWDAFYQCETPGCGYEEVCV